MCDTILYTWFGKKWNWLKKFWGWKICLVYAYFFKTSELKYTYKLYAYKNKYSCSGPPAIFLIVPQKYFLKKIININFIYLLFPFILQNFKKILRANPELWGCAIFGHRIAQFVLNKIYLVQTIIITFIYLFSLFTGQNFKNILTANPELWRCIIFGPKMLHLPQTKNFEKNH